LLAAPAGLKYALALVGSNRRPFDASRTCTDRILSPDVAVDVVDRHTGYSTTDPPLAEAQLLENAPEVTRVTWTIAGSKDKATWAPRVAWSVAMATSTANAWPTLTAPVVGETLTLVVEAAADRGWARGTSRSVSVARGTG
jgi:hypothetical protein